MALLFIYFFCLPRFDLHTFFQNKPCSCPGLLILLFSFPPHSKPMTHLPPLVCGGKAVVPERSRRRRGRHKATTFFRGWTFASAGHGIEAGLSSPAAGGGSLMREKMVSRFLSPSFSLYAVFPSLPLFWDVVGLGCRQRWVVWAVRARHRDGCLWLQCLAAQLC